GPHFGRVRQEVGHGNLVETLTRLLPGSFLKSAMRFRSAVPETEWCSVRLLLEERREVGGVVGAADAAVGRFAGVLRICRTGGIMPSAVIAARPPALAGVSHEINVLGEHFGGAGVLQREPAGVRAGMFD